MADKGQRSYIAIDLKSFYASVECRERELDPTEGKASEGKCNEAGRKRERCRKQKRNITGILQEKY